MADTTKNTEQQKSNAPQAAASTKGLAPAAESSDPEVHRLLAERQAHVMNAGLEEDPEQERVRKDAKEKLDEIDEKLAELGVTAK